MRVHSSWRRWLWLAALAGQAAVHAEPRMGVGSSPPATSEARATPMGWSVPNINVANLPASPTAPASDAAGNVWLQFVNVDIATVARSIGHMTGRQVLVDTRVEGRMTLQSTQAVSPAVAWDLFSQALKNQKLGMSLSQGIYTISPQGAQASPVASDAASQGVKSRQDQVSERNQKATAGQALNDEFEIGVEWAKAPKPNLPNPNGGLSQARLAPMDEPSATWTLLTQDKTLYHCLSRWSQAANWQLIWDADRDFPIQAQISIEGNFTSAIQLVMNALASTDYPLQAVMNDNTRVISIIRHQDPFAR